MTRRQAEKKVAVNVQKWTQFAKVLMESVVQLRNTLPDGEQGEEQLLRFLIELGMDGKQARTLAQRSRAYNQLSSIEETTISKAASRTETNMQERLRWIRENSRKDAILDVLFKDKSDEDILRLLASNHRLRCNIDAMRGTGPGRRRKSDAS